MRQSYQLVDALHVQPLAHCKLGRLVLVVVPGLWQAHGVRVLLAQAHALLRGPGRGPAGARAALAHVCGEAGGAEAREQLFGRQADRLGLPDG